MKKSQSKITKDPLQEGGVYKFSGGKFILVEPGPEVNLQLTPNQTYKSRDGRPVRIFEVNPGSVDFPIIGAIKDDDGFWVPRVYNEKGISKRPYGGGNDIVAEWSDT